MIHVEQIGTVTKFHLARTLLGRGRYFTACYWVGGVMVDTGCAHTVRELLHAMEGLPVGLILNTHSHEDHIAANAELQRLHGAVVMAHPLALPVLAAPREKQPLRFTLPLETSPGGISFVPLSRAGLKSHDRPRRQHPFPLTGQRPRKRFSRTSARGKGTGVAAFHLHECRACDKESGCLMIALIEGRTALGTWQQIVF